jgi:hypothetical protein
MHLHILVPVTRYYSTLLWKIQKYLCGKGFLCVPRIRSAIIRIKLGSKNLLKAYFVLTRTDFKLKILTQLKNFSLLFQSSFMCNFSLLSLSLFFLGSKELCFVGPAMIFDEDDDLLVLGRGPTRDEKGRVARSYPPNRFPARPTDRTRYRNLWRTTNSTCWPCISGMTRTTPRRRSSSSRSGSFASTTPRRDPVARRQVLAMLVEHSHMQINRTQT